MTKINKTYPMVEVLWIDAEEHGEVGWNDLKEQLKYAKKPCPTMRNIGYEVYRDDDHISLVLYLSYQRFYLETSQEVSYSYPHP